jgi:hypothetical protein
MTNKLATTFRLMMITEPKEETIKWTDKKGTEKAMVRESLEAYLLGSGTAMSVINININKFANGSQVRNVKITDLFKTFIKNEDDLKSGKKILLANVELLPVKNSFSETGVINRFEPYLSSFDLADSSEEDQTEIGIIKECTMNLEDAELTA